MNGRIMLAAAMMALVLPAGAQTLSDRYEARGTVAAEIGGETLELVVPFDLENKNAFALVTAIMGTSTSVNVVGMSVGETGKPAPPMVQATFLTSGTGTSVVSVELFDEGGMDAPAIMSDEFGSVTLDRFSFDGKTLEAEVSGQMQRVAGYAQGNPAADGAPPVPARIVISTEVAPAE